MSQRLEGKRIGFGFTGSHCSYHLVFPELKRLVALGAHVVPVISFTVKGIDTKFGEAREHVRQIEEITGKNVIDSMPGAEPLGPKEPLDLMVVAPLTGNSLSKLANALTDSPVLMAVKATLRNRRNVVLGMSTNDALGLNGVNLMRLLSSKHMFFVPFGQDDPFKKPTSLVAQMDLLVPTIEAALENKQLQPLIVSKSE